MITITQSAYAVGPSRQVSFLAAGGVSGYSWEVAPGGAGGVINADTGVYLSPAIVSDDPRRSHDIIIVTDNDGHTQQARVLVGTPLDLVCDILQRYLGLADGRVYIWNQKINQPTDSGLYIAVSTPYVKVFANNNRQDSAGEGLSESQYVSCMARVEIDIISRGPAARVYKEKVVAAFSSNYAERQMESNGFYISKLPTNFVDVSRLDGGAIPYRYRISLNMLYCYASARATEYYDSFDEPIVYTDLDVPQLPIISAGIPTDEYPDIISAGGPANNYPDIIDGGTPAQT